MRRLPLSAIPLGLCLLSVLSAPGQASGGRSPATQGMSLTKGALVVGAALPALTLPDTAGHRHSLGGMRQPVTLLFFCGCTPCHEFARLWSQVQQGGDLTPRAGAQGAVARDPATVVVFLGGADAARAFAAQTGLDPSQTLLLLDPSDRMGQKFGVVQCPRVFVTDGARRLVYTNPDDPAPPLSAPALVSRTLTAWRTVTAGKQTTGKQTTGKQTTGKRAAPGKRTTP